MAIKWSLIEAAILWRSHIRITRSNLAQLRSRLVMDSPYLLRNL